MTKKLNSHSRAAGPIPTSPSSRPIGAPSPCPARRFEDALGAISAARPTSA